MAGLAGELRAIVSAMDGRSVRDEIESGPQSAGAGPIVRVGLVVLVLVGAVWWFLR
jgi:hypothetical protein